MRTGETNIQPWIKKPLFDGLFILLPPFAALLAVMFLPARFKNTGAMPVAGWVLLILFVDVAHVYSTLFNTYLDRQRFSRHRTLFLLAPLACYCLGVLLHLWSGMAFWRTLAYLAVFHFIRQQYGFVRLYSRYEVKRSIPAIIDTIAIYAATIYPLVYWHCTPGRNFNWFINGDFLIREEALIKYTAFLLYVVILAAYIVKEVIQFFRTRFFNVPKNLIICSTFFTWYFGIVYFNGDMAFTLLNVVSHGIPYMALVWVDKDKTRKASGTHGLLSHSSRLVLFLGSLFLLAYLEEGLWDGFIWRDHPGVFLFFQSLPHIDNNLVLALLVPLLSLPQSTHYVLDGFIWRKGYQ